MALFKKIGKAFGKAFGTLAGFALGGPIGAVVGTGMGMQYRAGKKAAKAQKRAIASQEAEMARIAGDQRAQAELTRKEKERLQREESDMLRARRKRGRRSLLFENETGVEGTQGLRRTLG